MTQRITTPNWYVITGAQSSGKSTLLSALRPHVDEIFPEVARTLIDRNLGRGISVEQTKADQSKFQNAVLRQMLLNERRARRDSLIVFDRGIPDAIPYLKIAGLDPKPVYAYSAGRYKGVFFLELLPYTRDYARTRDEHARAKLNEMLPAVYVELGYRVVRIPRAPVGERVAMILSHLQRDGSVATAGANPSLQ